MTIITPIVMAPASQAPRSAPPTAMRLDISDLFAPTQPVTPISKAVEDHAMDTLQSIQGFFHDRYGFGSRDGNGRIPIEFDPTYENAAYMQDRMGREEIVIGSDPTTGKSYAVATDVLAHEYTHRIVNNILNLEPYGESGTVNESLADTFAAAIDTKNWTLGEDVRPGGLRSMIDPEHTGMQLRDQYGNPVTRPGNMKDYIETPDDDGGVHLNVGIPNKAAALIGQQLGRDSMADIYMGAIKNYMSPTSGIADTAEATLQSATDLFGARSKQIQAVRDAWDAVGIHLR